MLPSLAQWRKWFLMLTGRSPQHVPQGVGLYYSKSELRGYYSDLTNKYLGIYGAQTLDKNGIPINQLATGEWIYFPTTVAQYGLGAYDVWLSNRTEESYKAFVRCSEWLVENQDELGGWKVVFTETKSPRIPYSSMTQGQGASLLFRAGVALKGKSFFSAAEKAIDLMLLPIEKGGTARIEEQELVLEENPNKPGSAILNGWIFSIFGLYDSLLVFERQEWRSAFERTISSLEGKLELYDAGYWSFYDLNGHLASPFYHGLHIDLLKVLYELCCKEKFLLMSMRWNEYRKAKLKYARAFFTKAYEKIRDPGQIVIVK